MPRCIVMRFGILLSNVQITKAWHAMVPNPEIGGWGVVLTAVNKLKGVPVKKCFDYSDSLVFCKCSNAVNK